MAAAHACSSGVWWEWAVMIWDLCQCKGTHLFWYHCWLKGCFWTLLLCCDLWTWGLRLGLGRSAKWKCPSLICCLPGGRLLHIKWVCCYWFWMPVFLKTSPFLDVSVTVSFSSYVALWCSQCCKLQIEGKSWLLKGWDASVCFLIWKQIPAEVRSLVLIN